MQQRNRIKLVSAILFLSVFIPDQITKHLIHSNFRLHESKVIINNILNIIYVGNTGSAFSLFANTASWFRIPFFLIVPAIAMIVIVILLKKSAVNNKFEIFAFSLILGGAFGNFVDRIHYGYVVDFIQMHYKRYYWPVYNVADIGITIGVVMLFFGMTLTANSAKRKNRNDGGKRIPK
ncbi:MAG: signal peptidase II [Oligoflexia bacterium]|nr:signal peptidase II [Oligoflexia bacterium]